MASRAASLACPVGPTRAVRTGPGSQRCFPTALTRGSVWEPLCSVATPLGGMLLGRDEGSEKACRKGLVGGYLSFFLHPPPTPALVSSLCFKAPDTASSAVSAQAPPILFQLRPSALTRSVTCRSIHRLKGLQTPAHHSTVPPPRTCLGAQQAFWIQISAACGRNVPGPQHWACQPSSQGGPPSVTKRSGKQEGADREHLAWKSCPGPGCPPPHKRPAGLTQAPRPPQARAGAPRSRPCLPTGWSPLPSEPHFPELQNRLGPPTFREKMGVEMLEKAGVGPAWPCCLPEPRQPPPQLGPSIPPVLLHPSGEGFIPAAELRAGQSQSLGHCPLSSVTSQFPLTLRSQFSCLLPREAICCLWLNTGAPRSPLKGLLIPWGAVMGAVCLCLLRVSIR